MVFNMKTLTKKCSILYIVMALGFALSACSNTGTFEHAASLVPEETKTPPQAIAPIDPVDFEIETAGTDFEVIVEKIQWMDAYADFLRGVETYGYLQRDDIVPGSFDIPPVFCLYDIDQDGIPELILLTDDSNWENACCDIFTYSKNIVQQIGSVKWDWFGKIGAADPIRKGLFSDDGYKGHYGSLYYYTIQDGILVEQLVCEYQFRPKPGEKGYIRIYDDCGNIVSFHEDDEFGYAEEQTSAYTELFEWLPFCFYRITDESIQAAIDAETPIPIRIYSCIDVSSYGYDERYYEYQTIDLFADNFLEDAMKQLEIHGQISIDAMWYEGKRLCIDLNRTMFDRLNAGSSAGYILSNELLLTFASFPNTEEIVFMINGEESWGDHFNLFYIFPVSDSLQEMHDHAIARFSW